MVKSSVDVQNKNIKKYSLITFLVIFLALLGDNKKELHGYCIDFNFCSPKILNNLSIKMKDGWIPELISITENDKYLIFSKKTNDKNKNLITFTQNSNDIKLLFSSSTPKKYSWGSGYEGNSNDKNKILYHFIIPDYKLLIQTDSHNAFNEILKIEKKS